MDVTTPRQIGNSSLSVTPLGFGGGQLGSPFVTNDESLKTIQSAWDNGVRFYDTAPYYGLGRSERRLGMALTGVGEDNLAAPSVEFAVNPKVGKTQLPEPERDASQKTMTPGGEVRTPRDPWSGFRLHYDYSYEAILHQHQDSLQRMALPSIDSLTIHDIDLGTHNPEQIENHLEELSPKGGGGALALQTLRDSGAIKAIGCGCNLESKNAYSWENSDHEDLQERIIDLVDLDFLIVAGGYTLLETRAFRRLMPLCEEKNIGIIIAAPFAGGWLVAPEEEGTTYMYAPPSDEIVQHARKMSSICEEHGVPLAAAAIQFTLAHPCVAAVIPGSKTPLEAAQNYEYMHTEIPDAVWTDFKSEGLLNPDVPTPDQV